MNTNTVQRISDLQYPRRIHQRCHANSPQCVARSLQIRTDYNNNYNYYYNCYTSSQNMSLQLLYNAFIDTMLTKILITEIFINR